MLTSVLTNRSDTKDFLRLGANLETIVKATPSDSRFREETRWLSGRFLQRSGV